MPKVFEEYGLSKFDFDTIKSIFPSVDILDEERMRTRWKFLLILFPPDI